MKSNYLLCTITALPVMSCFGINKEETVKDKPNIIVILADDLGYGDLSCNNEHSKINTPNIDRIASQGVRFTDGHTSSAVSSPTRYGLLTGRYNWRSTLKSGVLNGYSAPLITQGRETIASMLQKNGYATGCFGKWHLGWTWSGIENGNTNVDFSKKITNGPTSLGFDTYLGFCGSLDMPPYVWVKDDMPTMVPTKYTQSEGQAMWRKGLTSDDFVHNQALLVITDKTKQFIHEKSHQDKPFFVYMPLSAPHTPILPIGSHIGKSGLENPYADFVLMVDSIVGEITLQLKKDGISENTMLVFISDNGCSPSADFVQLLSKGHNPSYIFRGNKADIFEGGHRVPYIVSYPKAVTPGVSDQIVCTTDLFATFADLIGDKYGDNTAEDSYSFMKALKLTTSAPQREYLVSHSINGSFAIRKGDWKVAFCPSSGGWSFPRPEKDTSIIKGLPKVQLYNLKTDIHEDHNLQAEYPKMVDEFRSILLGYIHSGRSTEGKPQKNDGPAFWSQLKWIEK
ncbi:MAG TPA: arylsulfatase [Bacteroidales bacterium]|nr:arylsulfatase [Bacteroidales bacterium]